MAISGSFHAYPVGSFGLYCTWSAVQNIPGNYSDVTITAYLQHHSLYVGARTNSTIKCGSDTYSYTAPAVSSASSSQIQTRLDSHTFRVYHDSAGGDKSVAVSASWTFNGTYSGIYVGTITASDTLVLDAIPRNSTISSVSVDANNKITVALSRPSSAFTHSVKFVFGTHSYTATGVGTSTSYAMPLSWLDTIPRSLTGTASVTVTTYSGSSTIGTTDTKDFIVSVPEDVKPTIEDIIWTKTSSEPSTWPLTKNVSQGTMSMKGVSGIYGSTITSYSLTFSGLSSNSNSLTVNNITLYGSLNAVAKVTDSRGRSFTKTVPFTVSDYAKPMLTVSAYRSDDAGNEAAEGDYMTITAVASAHKVGDNALSSLNLQYKTSTSASYTYTSLYSGTPRTIAASSNSTWDWTVTASDKVNSVSISGSIATGAVIFDILANGKGIKFGGVAEEEGFHSDWDFTGKDITVKAISADSIEAAGVNATDVTAECLYADQMQINNQDVVDHVIDQGTSGDWTYRKWSSGKYECWRFANYSGTTFPNTRGSMYYATRAALSFPITFASVPHIFLQSKSVNGILSGVGLDSATTTKSQLGIMYLYSPTNTSGDTYISIYVIGQWKS